jgi:hypothetical protein
MDKSDTDLIKELLGKNSSLLTRAAQRIRQLNREVERQAVLQDNAYIAGLHAGIAVSKDPDPKEKLKKIAESKIAVSGSKRLKNLRMEEKAYKDPVKII